MAAAQGVLQQGRGQRERLLRRQRPHTHDLGGQLMDHIPNSKRCIGGRGSGDAER